MPTSTWVDSTPANESPNEIIATLVSEQPGNVHRKVAYKVIYVPVSATFTGKTTRRYAVDTTAAAFTIYLPTDPQFGDWIDFIDATAQFGTNNLTLSTSDQPINTGTKGTASVPATLVLSASGAAFRMVYVNATVGWLQISNVSATTGTTLALTGAASATTFTANSGTTPQLITAAGKTNTGNLTINGKTSGSLIVTTADASAFALTVLAAARTVGTATITIPDTANVADTFALVTKAQTLANKTLTAPVIGVATGTSLAVTAGLTSSGATGAGIGYATGAGGAVSQATDRTTGVTINKLAGQITTQATSLAAAALVSFTVTNSTVAIGDTVELSIQSGPTTVGTIAYVTTVAAGSFQITLKNGHASTADTGAAILNFAVIKSVAA